MRKFGFTIWKHSVWQRKQLCLLVEVFEFSWLGQVFLILNDPRRVNIHIWAITIYLNFLTFLQGTSKLYTSVNDFAFTSNSRSHDFSLICFHVCLLLYWILLSLYFSLTRISNTLRTGRYFISYSTYHNRDMIVPMLREFWLISLWILKNIDWNDIHPQIFTHKKKIFKWFSSLKCYSISPLASFYHRSCYEDAGKKSTHFYILG